MPDRTFLVRKTEQDSLKQQLRYTISFRHHGNTHTLGIQFVNNKYSISGGVSSGGVTFESLPLLVQYYSEFPLPLSKHVVLKYPDTKLTEVYVVSSCLIHFIITVV